MQTWLTAHRKLRAHVDPGALHDFRVALRRLRSTLRAFRPYLLHPKGLRRRLRRLAQTTNESRNLEIWRDWIGAQAPKLTRRQRPGVHWLRLRLADRQQHANALMERRIEKWLPRLRQDLARVRSGAGLRSRLPLASQTARTAVARVLRAGARGLGEPLARVPSPQDRESSPAARYSTQRLAEI